MCAATAPGRGMPEPPPTRRPATRCDAARCTAAGTSSGVARQRPGHRVNGVTSSAASSVEVRQQPRQPLGQHRLARARRAVQVEVVTSGSGHLESSSRPSLWPSTSSKSTVDLRASVPAIRSALGPSGRRDLGPAQHATNVRGWHARTLRCRARGPPRGRLRGTIDPLEAGSGWRPSHRGGCHGPRGSVRRDRAHRQDAV